MADRHAPGDPSPVTPIHCSVCVATFQRPLLLSKLLASLEGQLLPEGVAVEVIVVDNDPRKTAGSIVAGFHGTERIRFFYFHQPVKNISLTRNMAVEKASGEYILFIDDDEVAPPEWISRLLEAMERFGTDGVSGPVMPEFHPLTPQWMRRRELFYDPMQTTGEPSLGTWTNNCIVRATTLKRTGPPFSPEYGVTGGGDAHLFERLEREGARFVYCREGWVSEYLPPRRTSIRYLFSLGFKGGHGHTRRIIAYAGRKHLPLRFIMVGKALSYGAASLAFMAVFLPNAFRRTYWLKKFAANLGRLLAAFGWKYQHYK